MKFNMIPPNFDNIPGFLGRHPTDRGLRAPEVPDTLSIPVMSTESERVFSSAKKLIIPERNALADDNY